MTYPPDVDGPQMSLLQTIYRLFRDVRDWPTFDTVDYETDRAGHGDAWTTLTSLPSGLVGGTDGRTLPAPGQQFHLSITGLHTLALNDADAKSDLQMLCSTIMVAVRAADEVRPPASATLIGTRLPDLIELPLLGRPALIARTYKLWTVNGHLWTQMSGNGDDWTATLNQRALRAYRRVDSVPSLLTAEERRLAALDHQRAQLLGASAPSVALPEVVRDPLPGPALPRWFEFLPEDLATKLESRVRAGHVEDAYLEGWKLLEHALHSLSGLTLHGADLVNQTYRGLDIATLPDADQEMAFGYFDLMRGLARVRNTCAHRSAAPFSNLEQAAFVLTLSACRSWVSQMIDATTTSRSATTPPT